LPQFRAWRGSSEKPTYRHWVLKTENPDVLALINALFVTVEPKVGSAKSAGERFLEAYLHSLPPNHL
jgi:hypothetical protein